MPVLNPLWARVLEWALRARVYVKCPSCPPGRVFGGGFAPYVFKASVTFIPDFDMEAGASFFDITVRAIRTDAGHFGDNHLTDQEKQWIEAKANDDLRVELVKLIGRMRIEEVEDDQWHKALPEENPRLSTTVQESRTALPSG